MNQQPLFHEDIFEALKTDVQAIGGSKKVGHMLWPVKSPEKAAEHLNNCLSVIRSEKLDGEQILFIKREAKKVGSFATIFFECEDVGMTKPAPIEPQDERAALQTKFIEATKHLDTLYKRLERLQGAE